MRGRLEVEATATTPENRVGAGFELALGDGWRRGKLVGRDVAAVQIIADKKNYAPGDVAHLSIVSQVAGFPCAGDGNRDIGGVRRVVSSMARR